jgi:hypothetical protein
MADLSSTCLDISILEQQVKTYIYICKNTSDLQTELSDGVLGSETGLVCM